MYDIEFCIPVTLKDHYLQRLLDFRKYGLLNLQNKQVVVKLIAGPEIISEEILSDWPCTVVAVNCPRPHPVAKLGDYYLSEIDSDSARWFARVDDDSINDVCGLVDNLDAEYDHTREFFLAATIRQDVHHQEKDALNRVGFKHWNQPSGRRLYHGFEADVVSQAGMKRILGTRKAVEFLQQRLDNGMGVFDQFLAIAAQIAKIYPINCHFMSHDPLLKQFSLCGGEINHIHLLAHDVNTERFNRLKYLVDSKLLTAGSRPRDTTLLPRHQCPPV